MVYPRMALPPFESGRSQRNTILRGPASTARTSSGSLETPAARGDVVFDGSELPLEFVARTRKRYSAPDTKS